MVSILSMGESWGVNVCYGKATGGDAGIPEGLEDTTQGGKGDGNRDLLTIPKLMLLDPLERIQQVMTLSREALLEIR
jgi:hypothetical protein